MNSNGKIIFVIGPPRSGSSMTAAFLNQCGAWGRIHGDVHHSGFHLNVVDRCLLLPNIERASYLLDLAGTNLPGVPCPVEGLEAPDAVTRITGALASVGWTGGTAVVRSHLALPFVPSLNRQFADAAFVFVHRDPLDACDSVRRTGWMPLREDRDFWYSYISRFNTEMTRFSQLPDVRGFTVYPQHLINGNNHEIMEVSRRLGLNWTPEAETLFQSVKREAYHG